MNASGADIYSKSEVQVDIYLLNGVVNQEHYWVFNSNISDHVINVFDRVSAKVTIKAAIYSAYGPCNNSTICYTLDSTGQLTNKPLVMWKNPYLRFFVTRSMTVKNVIFDGADIVTYLDAYTTGKVAVLHPNSTTQKARFCIQQNISNSSWVLVPNPDYPQSKHPILYTLSLTFRFNNRSALLISNIL